MKIIFKNLADDVNALVSVGGGEEISVSPLSDYELELDEKAISFSVYYKRNFDIDLSVRETDKIMKWLGFSIGNLIVQIKNTYCVNDMIDGDVIELKDSWHYVPTTNREAFYKCLPSVYYLSRAECKNAKVEAVSAIAFNKEAYVKFYKKFLVLMNLSGWFRIIKYKKQLKRQRRISSDECLTKTMKGLYEMSYDDRKYQFQPIVVIFDRVVDAMFSKIKIPKKIKAKLQERTSRIKAAVFE